MTIARRLALTSLILELSGILLLIIVIASYMGAQVAAASPIIAQTAPAKQREYPTEVIHGKPVRISVPSLGISTSIEAGYYDSASGLWTISEDAAFFATISDEINNKSGSTFIYGHNSDKIFGKLRAIKDGASAIVTTDTSYTFIYRFTKKEDVAPIATDTLRYDGNTPRLVLQTCSGFWNQTRQMTYFTLESYSKN